MKRWPIVLIAAAALACIALLGGYHVGVKLLQGRIIEALGKGGQLRELKVNWFTIELSEVSIDAPKGWPAARALEAQRVIIVPDLRSLLSDRLRIISIVVEKPYLSLLRTPGKLRLVPSLTEDRSQSNRAGSSARAVTISRLHLKDGTLDLYDATVGRPPLRARVERIDAVFRDITAPAEGKIHFDLAGIVKGIKRDGTMKLAGWIGPGATDSSSRVLLAGVDLVLLQPYLVKKSDVQVSSGSLDLNLDSQVRKKNLDGRGKLVLRNLEFAPSRGFFDTFMGLPRTAVISFLKDNNNAIAVDFTLAGDTESPHFSLNENLSTRIAASMAGTLGVGIVNVAEGIGNLGRRGVEGAGSVVEGIGSAIKGLFGGQQ